MRSPRAPSRPRRAPIAGSGVRPIRNRGGKDAAEPPPGWRGHPFPIALLNPKSPSVPATLDLTLEDYYTSSAVIGMLASQFGEPNREWACRWVLDFGEKLARASRKRRRKR